MNLRYVNIYIHMYVISCRVLLRDLRFSWHAIDTQFWDFASIHNFHISSRITFISVRHNSYLYSIKTNLIFWSVTSLRTLMSVYWLVVGWTVALVRWFVGPKRGGELNLHASICLYLQGVIIVYFPKNFVNILNSASSAAALIFYLPGVCTLRENRERKESGKF